MSPEGVAAALLATLLCGCGLSMDKSLKPMVGHNLEVAVAKLGNPNSQQAASGETIYVWSSTTQGSALMMPGTTGGGMTKLGSDPTVMSSFASALVPFAATCSVAMAVDATNTITRYAWRGNDCSHYLRAMRQ